MSKHTKKAVFRIRHWREYNQALVRRGSLTVWVDEEALDAWAYQGPAQWGGQYLYSDTAIQCLLTIRAVFHLPLRATRGMAQGLRIFNIVYCEYFGQVVIIPTTTQSLGLEARVGGLLLLQQADGELSQQGQVLATV